MEIQEDPRSNTITISGYASTLDFCLPLPGTDLPAVSTKTTHNEKDLLPGDDRIIPVNVFTKQESDNN